MYNASFCPRYTDITSHCFPDYTVFPVLRLICYFTLHQGLFVCSPTFGSFDVLGETFRILKNDLSFPIPFCRRLIKKDTTPVRENPIHIPSVPPIEPIILTTSYIKYSSWIVTMFWKRKPSPNVAFG